MLGLASYGPPNYSRSIRQHVSHVVASAQMHQTRRLALILLFAPLSESGKQKVKASRNAYRLCSLNSRTTRRSQYVEKEQYHKRIGRKQIRVQNNLSPCPVYCLNCPNTKEKENKAQELGKRLFFCYLLDCVQLADVVADQ